MFSSLETTKYQHLINTSNLTMEINRKFRVETDKNIGKKNTCCNGSRWYHVDKFLSTVMVWDPSPHL